mgnify:CR=1 FL=1
MCICTANIISYCKNIIYLTTLILFTTTIAFSQIEKVDTSIVVTPINFNPPGTAHYLDLDLDGIDDTKL